MRDILKIYSSVLDLIEECDGSRWKSPDRNYCTTELGEYTFEISRFGILTVYDEEKNTVLNMNERDSSELSARVVLLHTEAVKKRQDFDSKRLERLDKLLENESILD